ncbi:MAG TPA: M48 family metalloprotease, partial [Myxococcaceae bacterium]|nr:M48 family metalloprotease [Myxococcaceae bacterium]
ALGGAVAARWVKEGGGVHGGRLKSDAGSAEARELTLYLNRVGRHLAARSSRPTLEWTFGVLDSPAVNAVSAPAGYVFITCGLLERLENEAQLAGVLAHEIAHVTGRHALTSYATVKSNQCYTALGGGELQGTLRNSAELFRQATRELDGELRLDDAPQLLARLMDDVVEDLTTRGFAHSDEFASDEEALRLVIAAGYRPHEYIAFLGRLPDGDQGYRNHPRNAERQTRLNRWLAEQRPRPGEFPEVDPDFGSLPVVPLLKRRCGG